MGHALTLCCWLPTPYLLCSCTACPSCAIAVLAGDLASTLQAFVVPGLIGIILCRKTKLGSGTSIYARLRHVSSYGTAVFAVILGLALFANGIYQRL